jgi:1-acyl-sn-glycerol-3-phosphate acyltransferase
MAQLLRLPLRQAGHAGHAASDAAGRLGEVLSSPLRPWLLNNSVDDWGRDPQLIRALGPLAGLRWDVTVGGEEHIPAHGGALLVANARRLSLSSLYSSWALSKATGRPVRFVGRPDVAPVGALMRRFGALLTDPDEIGSALVNGELVMVSTTSTSHPRHAGTVPHELIAAAVLSNSPVIPVATMSSPMGRAARVEVDMPAKPPRKRRGPLAEVELAELVQRRLQKLLEEMGGIHTGVGAIDVWGEG